MREVCFAVLLVACGSSAPRPAEPTTTEPAAIAISREPWSITFANDSVLSYAANGTLSLDGDAIGTLGDDARLMQGETELAKLLPDGAMTLRGAPLAPRIQGSRMEENGAALLDIDDADAMHVRAPDGRELATFDVDGATPSARPTILFLTAIYLLEAAHARRDADDAATVDEEAETEAETDDDLWRMPIDDAPTEGPRDALVTIVELTDFQCPYCSRGAAAMAAIRARYPDDVRLVVRQRPLPFHENARPAAEAALEARAQLGDEGFFRMGELLFANQRNLTRGSLEAIAIAVGLDLDRFRTALDHDAHEDVIARDLALGDRLGAEGTPTFYVNGELIVGAQPLASFVHAVERARARAQDALDHGTPRDHLYEALIAHAREHGDTEPDAIPAAPDVHFVDLAIPESAPALGSTSARTTVQVFFDPASAHATEARALIDRLQHDPVRAPRVVFRFAPRESTGSFAAAEAVLAVSASVGAEAGARYAMELMTTPTSLGSARLIEVADRIAHVPADVMRAALEGHTTRARVDRDRRALRDASLSGSPVLFVVGRRVVWGVPDYDALAQAIDGAIAHPDEGHPTAPSASAPSGAHSGEGASWITETTGHGDAAETRILARWASWSGGHIVFDGTSGVPLELRFSDLQPPLRAALSGMRAGETRRVWLPGGVAMYVEATDAE
jgi:protein-disulfide isomerase